MERRFCEFRAEGRTIYGSAVSWNRAAKIGEFSELFERGSLKPHQAGVSLYFQHDNRRLLGNSQSGTLKVKNAPEGLLYSAVLPASAEDIREAAARKDLRGASVGFEVKKEKWDGNTRIVKEGILWEISLVDKPAHASSVSLRSHGLMRRARSWHHLIVGV